MSLGQLYDHVDVVADMVAWGKKLGYQVAKPEDVPLEATVTNMRAIMVSIHNPAGQDVTLAPGQSVDVNVPYKTLAAWQQMGGLQVTLKPFPAGSGKAQQEADAKLKNFATVYGVFKPGVPKGYAKSDAELTQKMSEHVYHSMLEQQALSMKLVTIADVEKWLKLMGYAEYRVVAVDNVVIVEVVGIAHDHTADLENQLRQQLVTQLDIEVWEG